MQKEAGIFSILQQTAPKVQQLPAGSGLMVAGENHGKMFADGVTPDGYKVNAAGQWIDGNGKVQVVEGKGFASDPSRNTKGSETSLRGGNGGGGSSRSGSGNSNAGSNVMGLETIITAIIQITAIMATTATIQTIIVIIILIAVQTRLRLYL